MMKRTKLIAMLIALCMVVELLPSNKAFAAYPEDVGEAVIKLAVENAGTGSHEHCICGVAHNDIFGHTTDDSKTFTATTSLPTEAGCYYLT